MNDVHDPLELLRAAAPRHERLEPGDDPAADQLLENILASPIAAGDQRRRRRRRRTAVFTGLAVATVSAGTVAAVVLTRDQPDDLTSVACWSNASVTPSEVVVVPWDGSDPTIACMSAWENGQFETVDSRQAPPLMACVNAAGGLVVVPGDAQVCASLELASFDSEGESSTDQLRDVVEEIENTVTEAACLSGPDAVDAIEEILDAADISDWTIVPPEPTPAETCMTVGIDTSTRTVFVVPGVDSDE